MTEGIESDYQIMRTIIPDPERAEYVGGPNFRRTLKAIQLSVNETRRVMTWIFEQDTGEGLRQVTRTYTFTPSKGARGYEMSGDEMHAQSSMGDVENFLLSMGNWMLSAEQVEGLRDFMGLALHNSDDTDHSV